MTTMVMLPITIPHLIALTVSLARSATLLVLPPPQLALIAQRDRTPRLRPRLLAGYALLESLYLLHVPLPVTSVPPARLTSTQLPVLTYIHPATPVPEARGTISMSLKYTCTTLLTIAHYVYLECLVMTLTERHPVQRVLLGKPVEQGNSSAQNALLGMSVPMVTELRVARGFLVVITVPVR